LQRALHEHASASDTSEPRVCCLAARAGPSLYGRGRTSSAHSRLHLALPRLALVPHGALCELNTKFNFGIKFCFVLCFVVAKHNEL